MNAPRPLTSTPARLGLLGSLYFAQGLPFGFFTQALPVLMRKSGHSLGQIGFSSLLALPWALKFLWAPAVDRYWDPRLGRRRSWILPLQLAGVAILTILALSGGAHSLRAIIVAILLLNLVAATQDIGTDGLAVDILAERERGIANGLHSLPRRLRRRRQQHRRAPRGGRALDQRRLDPRTWTDRGRPRLFSRAQQPIG
jgi:PAT family beta-lactamase induction signal transducer AmpG